MVPHSTKCDVPLLGAQCDSEEQSDVVFWVCADGVGSVGGCGGGGCGAVATGAAAATGERWRVPAHRRVLAAASPVFAAMLEGPMAEGREVVVRDVERRAFDLLLRHIYGETVELQSVETALSTLYAAHKYHCEKLERHCLEYLCSNINVSTVLAIMHDVHLYYNTLGTTSSAAPSAPSLDVIESCVTENANLFEGKSPVDCSSTCYTDDLQKICTSDIQHITSENVIKVPLQVENQYNLFAYDIQRDYKRVMKHCLNFIDLHADEVLRRELLDELSQEELLLIVQRDSLRLSSEVVLFTALEKWGKSICKRNCWELSPNNCRRALGDELLFSVRYLLMTSEEFLNYPMRSKLLSSEECNVLLGHILNHSVIPGSSMLEKFLPVLGRSRKPSSDSVSPSRSLSNSIKEKISIKMNKNSSQLNVKPKKLVRKKKESIAKEEVRMHDQKPNMSDYFFSCVACIFD